MLYMLGTKSYKCTRHDCKGRVHSSNEVIDDSRLLRLISLLTRFPTASEASRTIVNSEFSAKCGFCNAEV